MTAQSMAALARATQIRELRAQMKRGLSAHEISVNDLLRDPPEWLETMKVWDLLRAVPAVGLVRAGQILTHCQIAFSKTVGGLSDRQMDVLREAMRGR
jgi:hypothetical protein